MVVRMEPEEVKLFITKSKTNFMVCFQLVKPEEFLMRNTLSLRSNFEKYIQTQCSKIIQMEIKGQETQIAQIQRNTLTKALREKHVSHTRNTIGDRNTDSKYNNLNPRRRVNSMLVSNNKTKSQPISELNEDANGFIIDELEEDCLEENEINTLLRKTSKTKRKKSFDNFKFHEGGSNDNILESNFSSINEGRIRSLSRETSDMTKNTNTGDKPQIDYFMGNSAAQRKRVRNNSIYSIYYTWSLSNFLVKVGDDVRQEHFAMQLIYEFDSIFKEKGLKLRLTPYEILPIGPDACLVEMIQDAISLDSLKKKLQKQHNRKISLFEFFGLFYNTEEQLNEARKNFCYSLAAYSLLSYFLQLKDRHNGNIMLHRDGRIVHIDFGFLFTKSPGGSIEKKVPFKLTSEYVAVLGDKAKKFVNQFTR